MADETVGLRHVIAALIEQNRQDSPAVLAAFIAREMVAHARHAEAFGCERCGEIADRYQALLQDGQPSDLDELETLIDELTSHMTLDDDLRRET